MNLSDYQKQIFLVNGGYVAMEIDTSPLHQPLRLSPVSYNGPC